MKTRLVVALCAGCWCSVAFAGCGKERPPELSSSSGRPSFVEPPGYREVRVFVLDPVIVTIPAEPGDGSRERKGAQDIVRADGLETRSPGEGWACPAPTDGS